VGHNVILRYTIFINSVLLAPTEILNLTLTSEIHVISVCYDTPFAQKIELLFKLYLTELVNIAFRQLVSTIMD
jgi:hypothetical protein